MKIGEARPESSFEDYKQMFLETPVLYTENHIRAMKRWDADEAQDSLEFVIYNVACETYRDSNHRVRDLGGERPCAGLTCDECVLDRAVKLSTIQIYKIVSAMTFVKYEEGD